ncbi:MAG TPA: nucleotidyltransferase domain-containing protein [Solirubrobacterales bacterium]|nr:nucleotidyltransferase domain-containing protein [Solirubrobacterales bacterium]
MALQAITDELIAEAARRLAAAAPDAQIILFGSHARGDADEHSDLDFLVIEPEVESWGEESIRLRRQLHGLCVAADVIVVSRGYAEKWRDTRGDIVHAALGEGKVLAG